MSGATVLPSLSSHALVVLWTDLAALLVLARLLGSLARRLHQPPVIGELLAGLLLGPSVLGTLSPTAERWFLPPGHPQGDLLQTVGEFALLVLLVVVGAETDLPLIRRLGRAAAAVSATSLVLPLAAGVAAALVLPVAFHTPHAQHLAFVLLMAGAIGVSSLPVVAKIVGDMGLMRRNFAQIALAAGTTNDVTGFLIATVATAVAGSRTSSGSSVAFALGGLALVTVVIFTAGQRAIDVALRQVRRAGPNPAGSITVALVAAFAAAAATQAFGVEGALGGFLAGMALGRSRFQQGAAMEELTRFTNAVLAPLFFATAGLRVDLGTLAPRTLLIATAAITLGAIVVKFASAVLGARVAGLSTREGSALGVALNGRGTLQIIIAGAGLSAGVLTPAGYTAIIVLAIVSSVAVAPLLSKVVRGWRGSPEEEARLQEESRLEENLVVRDGRLLLASGGRPGALLAAALVHRAWPLAQPATVLAVDLPEEVTDEGDIRGAGWMFPGRQVERRRVASPDVLHTILAESRLGYCVLALGAAERPQPDQLLSAVVDDVLVRCPIPMLVARRALHAGTDRPSAPDMAFSRILVPVAGSSASRAAQEVAYGLAESQRVPVFLMHVVTRPRPAGGRGRSTDQTAQRLLRDSAQFAASHGVGVQTRIRRAPAAGEEIVRQAREIGADLIVLGATARAVDGRPFLGHSVEHVLAQAECAVVVAVLPSHEATTEPTAPTDQPLDKTDHGGQHLGVPGSAAGRPSTASQPDGAPEGTKK